MDRSSCFVEVSFESVVVVSRGCDGSILLVREVSQIFPFRLSVIWWYIGQRSGHFVPGMARSIERKATSHASAEHVCMCLWCLSYQWPGLAGRTHGPITWVFRRYYCSRRHVHFNRSYGVYECGLMQMQGSVWAKSCADIFPGTGGRFSFWGTL